MVNIDSSLRKRDGTKRGISSVVSKSLRGDDSSANIYN